MKKLSIICFVLILFGACTKDVISSTPDEDYTISVSVGPDSKVTSALGENNAIDFKWSEGDSLFVTLVEKDSIATLSTDKVNTLPTYIFKLKTGAGSSSATFTSKSFIPSAAMMKGRTYTMFAAYRPAILNDGSIWSDCGNYGAQIHVTVPMVQQFDNENPVRNIGETDVLIGRGQDITIDSNPEIIFHHCIGVIKVNVRNTGSSDLRVKAIEVPIQKSSWYSFYDNLHFTYTYQCRLNCQSMVTIAPGTTNSFYVASTFYIIDAKLLNFDVILEDESVIRVQKMCPGGWCIDEGKMYKTTLDVKLEMSSSGSIPGIVDKDEDDF